MLSTPVPRRATTSTLFSLPIVAFILANVSKISATDVSVGGVCAQFALTGLLRLLFDNSHRYVASSHCLHTFVARHQSIFTQLTYFAHRYSASNNTDVCCCRSLWNTSSPPSLLYVVRMSIAAKYKAAIAFLCVVLFISVILVFVYYALKRGLCNCFGSDKHDDEEGLYDDAERDENDYDQLKTELGQEENEDIRGLSNDHLDLTQPQPHVHKDDMDQYNQMRIPEVIVTESDFVEPHHNKRKISHINSILKKIRRPGGRVRFQESPVAETTALMNTDVNIYGNHSNHSNHYGIELSPIRRSDSMESFMSGLSSVTTNAEEFGDELSPSRLQIFIQYTPKQWMLTVGVKQAECLLTPEKQHNTYWQVHMTLLPFKKDRFKTRYKSTSTPVFNDSFDVDNIAKQALTQMSVRYRLYGRAGRTGRKKLAGEVEIELGCLTHKQDNMIKEWRILKRKNTTFRNQGNQISDEI